MEVCRICLAADRTMFVLDTKHKQLYESVTGITVQPIDRLPKHICWECKHFMSKYYTFRRKAETSHYILTEILTTQNKTFTTLEKHQPKLTLTCTGIWYSNLDGVDHEELDEIAAVDDEAVIEVKNEADLIWDEARNFRRKESVEVVSNIYMKIESVENVSNITENIKEIIGNENKIQNIEKTVKNLNNLEITNDGVKNNIDIETTEETVENPNNEILDNLPEDYTDDDENESFVSDESVEISCKSVKNISSEPIDEISKFKKKFGLNNTWRTVTILSKEEHVAEMKKEEENYNYVRKEFLDDIETQMEVHSKLPADGPHCERCGLRFASQEAFDDHKMCSTNLADKRTTKITPRLAEPMVVNGIEFAKCPRVELRKYYAPPGYPPLFGAPLKKPKADSLKVKNSSKTSNEAVYSDANIAELSKRSKYFEEAKEKANCTETVEGDKNNSLIETCKDKFICDECGQQFIKKDNIILHMKTKHVKDRLEKHSKLNCEKRKYFCEEYNNRFISKNILKRHKQRCGIKNNVSNTHSAFERYLCTKCGMKFILKHDFIRHMRTHTGEKPYVCTVCNKQFSRSDCLNEHMRTHTGEKPYVCTVCNKQFSRSSHLHKHIRTHTGEKPYSCTVCKKQFSQSTNLNKHMRTHTGEKTYSCTVCKKQFSQSSHLDKHIRTHTAEKPYSCTVCKKQFSQSTNLNIHMRTHTGEKPYSCTVCSKQFSLSCNLNSQMRTHTGEKPYLCTVCKKQFSRSDCLNEHMRTHTGEKPYSCTVCKKQFSQSGHLGRHMGIHTGAKPYSCTVCSKLFSLSHHLNSHMRTHTSEKPYSCTVCKKQFSQSTNLNIHMRTHTGEKPYSCSVCKKRFSVNSDWRRHSRKCK